ncbi:MAG TPA: 50S ribosomal protein L23 [Patescibacteria group bacterium]|nr:50S ribosomal protein L23 [Patescibacteria group bacterium]
MANAQKLRRPIITEKSITDAKDGWFTFRVVPDTTKEQIKRMIESQFNVHVVEVRTMRIAGKTRRSGKRRLLTETPSYKKALVKLKSGEKINLFEVSE